MWWFWNNTIVAEHLAFKETGLAFWECCKFESVSCVTTWLALEFRFVSASQSLPIHPVVFIEEKNIKDRFFKAKRASQWIFFIYKLNLPFCCKDSPNSSLFLPSTACRVYLNFCFQANGSHLLARIISFLPSRISRNRKLLHTRTNLTFLTTSLDQKGKLQVGHVGLRSLSSGLMHLL